MVPSPRSVAAIKKFLVPLLLVCWNIQASTAFAPAPSVAAANANRIRRFTAEKSNDNASSDDNNNNNNNNIDNNNNNSDDPPNAVPSSPSSFEMDTATVRIDDGGSDLTDRFKHKVHALMGDYDPAEGMADDENQDGNIMRALITFPMLHTFDVVGRVSAEQQTKDDENDNENENESDNENNDDYAERVKRIVFETTGDEDMEVEVVPRGKKFTKVRCRAMVESTTMINAIYDELGQMESTVMKF